MSHRVEKLLIVSAWHFSHDSDLYHWPPTKLLVAFLTRKVKVVWLSPMFCSKAGLIQGFFHVIVTNVTCVKTSTNVHKMRKSNPLSMPFYPFHFIFIPFHLSPFVIICLSISLFLSPFIPIPVFLLPHLGSILDSQLNWESGKFQLARWSHEVVL